jgi:hypothetical protein
MCRCFFRTQPRNWVAVETDFFTMDMQDATGREVQTPGKYSATYVWQDGRWRLVNHHTSPVPSTR